MQYNVVSSSYLPDYPHKYGSEGGCADHSVFERMKKYQASGVEEPVKVSACITTKPLPFLPAHKLNTLMDKAHEIKKIFSRTNSTLEYVYIFSRVYMLSVLDLIIRNVDAQPF